MEHLFNEKKLFYLFIFFLINSNSHSDIVYLDVQYIVDNSNLVNFIKIKLNQAKQCVKKLKNKEKLYQKENEIKIKKIF